METTINQELLIHVVRTLAIIVVAWIGALLLKKALNIGIRNYVKKFNSDPSSFVLLRKSLIAFYWALVLFLIFYQIPSLKNLGTALFAGTGVLAMAIGFASQKAFANIISGLFVLVFKPFRIGDTIEIEATRIGVVEEITLMHTIIRDLENKRIVIPNTVINDQTLVNYTIQDVRIRKHVVFSISYSADIDRAIAIIREEAMRHPATMDERTPEEKEKSEPIVTVSVVKLGDYSVDLKAIIWCRDNAEAVRMMFDLYKSVKQRFDREGIEIPFPTRTVFNKNI